MITKSSRRIRKSGAASSPARPTPDTIEMANDAEFGLADYFYIRDIGRI
jgi:hypothetical protein